MHWYRYSSPASFYPIAGAMIPWFAWAAAILTVIGLVIGLSIAPTDFQQGDSYRIIFIHVPAAWMSMFLYLVMAFWSALALGFKFHRRFLDRHFLKLGSLSRHTAARKN